MKRTNLVILFAFILLVTTIVYGHYTNDNLVSWKDWIPTWSFWEPILMFVIGPTFGMVLLGFIIKWVEHDPREQEQVK